MSHFPVCREQQGSHKGPLFNVPKNENSLFTFMPFQMSMAFFCLTQTEIFKEIIHFL